MKKLICSQQIKGVACAKEASTYLKLNPYNGFNPIYRMSCTDCLKNLSTELKNKDMVIITETQYKERKS